MVVKSMFTCCLNNESVILSIFCPFVHSYLLNADYWEAVIVNVLWFFMSSDISSPQEEELLGSPIARELEQEISESQAVHQNLLEYSRTETLILPSNQCEHEAYMESGQQMETEQQMESEQQTKSKQQKKKSEQQWTSTQKQLIGEYRIYYKNMGLLVDKIDSNGPTGKMPKLPKKPKQRLGDVYGPKKVNKEKMTPQELHKYLADNIADVNHTISRETFNCAYLLSGNDSEENIVDKLKKGIRNLKRQDAQTLLIYINFGNYLNLTKAWLENERKEGRIEQSWSAWLKEKTGYSDDHARKLRALAKVLHGYEQFFHVGLPLNFILRKLKEIEIMLQIPELNAFWKMPVVLPATNILQPSQDD